MSVSVVKNVKFDEAIELLEGGSLVKPTHWEHYLYQDGHGKVFASDGRLFSISQVKMMSHFQSWELLKEE